jgi:hypothetical protein
LLESRSDRGKPSAVQTLPQQASHQLALTKQNYGAHGADVVGGTINRASTESIVVLLFLARAGDVWNFMRFAGAETDCFRSVPLAAAGVSGSGLRLSGFNTTVDSDR